jgi:SAM-dependent MidA family methyltransferase
MNVVNFPNSPKLQNIIVNSINNSVNKQMTFAEYMNLVLYHPNYGYYNSGAVKIGATGDFFTSSSLGKDFGELLAVQFIEMWHTLGCPNPFYLVEMGAGNGQLAYDILAFLEIDNNCFELIKALKYIIIEQSPTLIETQKKLVKSFKTFDIDWKTWDNIPDNTIDGCFFSNELIDAFPVHLVTKNQGEIQEVYLTIEQDKLTETIAPVSTEELIKYFDLVEINLFDPRYSQNYRTEVNLNALNWLETLANKLKRGYILTIDYGYTAEKYYRPQRNKGTLQCYYQHRRHNNPYVNIGYQDITAHADFTALERQGELNNLENIGFTQQGLLLMALGLGDRLNELSSGKYDLSQIFKRRNTLHQLIDPTGLGGFGVLLQGKGLTEKERSLRGLITPPMF